MSGSKHTPCPWMAWQPRADESVPVRTDGLGITIAYVHQGAITNAKANASLIAAAPELLDALKGLVSEEWAEMDDDDLAYELSQGNEMVRSYIAARAAIAKAEGRS